MYSLRSQEEVDMINTSRVLRSARKLRGMTQADAAADLEISQSMISKLEKGFLSPSASLWFSATKLYKIPVTDSFETGYIDTLYHKSIVDHSLSHFRIPEKYIKDPKFSVRSINPLIHYFYKKKGLKFFKTFFKSIKFDPDYFYILDAKVNSLFLTTLIEALQKSANLDHHQIQKMMEEVSSPMVHGNLRHLYDRAKTTKDLLKIFADHSESYESYYTYSFKDMSATKVSITLSDAGNSDRSEKLNHFLYQYRREFLKNLSNYKNSKGIKSIKESITTNKGASTCTFEIVLME